MFENVEVQSKLVPRLIINENIISLTVISINLSKHFMKKSPLGSCEITKYAISYVYDNEHGTTVQESIWKDLFTMDEKSGSFLISSF